MQLTLSLALFKRLFMHFSLTSPLQLVTALRISAVYFTVAVVVAAVVVASFQHKFDKFILRLLLIVPLPLSRVLCRVYWGIYDVTLLPAWLVSRIVS